MTSRFGYITAISLSYLIFSMIQITVTSSSMPIPGSYNGTLRPQVHYSPPQYFMNDPNGMFVDANGTWHLYYQCMWYNVEIRNRL
jgi:beta-fructofuranosidase